MRRIPPSLLLGCATSAYQIEGGIRNDWTLWEEAGRLKDPGARCGVATDHWNRWQDDFRLLAGIGANAYRLSIEWSRIEPAPGEYDDTALGRYAEMISALRDLKIEPFVTLLHFTHPTWFHARCPWHDPKGEAVERFAAFTAHVARAMKDKVTFWTVLNEPGAWLSGAYLAGVIPPGMRSLRDLGRALIGLVRAHAAAHRILKAESGGRAQVGVAHNVLRFLPARPRSIGDRFVADYVHAHYNHALPRALIDGRVRLGSIPGLRIDQPVPEAKGTLDFLGVNYYSRVFIRLKPLPRPTVPVEPFYEDRDGHGVSDLGWEIHPSGMTDVLVEMARYRLPIYITENGLDDRDDSRRAAFLYDHLSALLDAIERGADVRGYLHWSLVDNFEWLEAYGPRFGLFTVDYTTLERSPTRAAETFRAIIGERALPDRAPERKVKRGVGPTPVF